MELTPEGNYRWSPGDGRTYELTPAGWQVMKVASEALQQGYDEEDPQVTEYLNRKLPSGVANQLTANDRQVLIELRYGFAI